MRYRAHVLYFPGHVGLSKDEDADNEKFLFVFHCRKHRVCLLFGRPDVNAVALYSPALINACLNAMRTAEYDTANLGGFHTYPSGVCAASDGDPVRHICICIYYGAC